MVTSSEPYPARLDVDRLGTPDRFTTFFRVIWVIPIFIIFALLSGSGDQTVVSEIGERIRITGLGTAAGLSLATMLMIVFRPVYPRWWFDFARELTRFGARVGAYLALLTDRYPSTVDEQSVHLENEYPNVETSTVGCPWCLAARPSPLHNPGDPHRGRAVVVVVIAWFAPTTCPRHN